MTQKENYLEMMLHSIRSRCHLKLKTKTTKKKLNVFGGRDLRDTVSAS